MGDMFFVQFFDVLCVASLHVEEWQASNDQVAPEVIVVLVAGVNDFRRLRRLGLHHLHRHILIFSAMHRHEHKYKYKCRYIDIYRHIYYIDISRHTHTYIYIDRYTDI